MWLRVFNWITKIITENIIQSVFSNTTRSSLPYCLLLLSVQVHTLLQFKDVCLLTLSQDTESTSTRYFSNIIVEWKPFVREKSIFFAYMINCECVRLTWVKLSPLIFRVSKVQKCGEPSPGAREHSQSCDWSLKMAESRCCRLSQGHYILMPPHTCYFARMTGDE